MIGPISRKELSRVMLATAAGWIFLVGGILSACSSPQNPPTALTPGISEPSTPSPLPPTSTPEALTSTPTPEITPTIPPQGREKPLYRISATLDYPNHRLLADEELIIPHPANDVLDEIKLVVPANNWPGVFSIQDLEMKDLTLDSYQLSGVVLQIQFGDPGWTPGQDLELRIRYQLDLPQMNTQISYGPSAFGYSSLQTNLVDWYPMVPPYQEDQGWTIHEPWIFGEYLVYPAADFEINLETDAEDLVVAASAAPLDGEVGSQYALESARNFVFSISPSYQTLESAAGETEVVGYFFPGYQLPGQAAVDSTSEAWTLYQDLFGPNPQPRISVIQGDFNHGVEYEGVYFQSRGFFDTYTGSQESYLTAISVHETAHQWWYGQVANDQALEPWLDEALSTFSELAYYEHLYPESVDWWWYTRVNYYQPEGDLEGSIYSYAEFPDQYLRYRNATYLQGARFFSELIDEMGEEVFYTFLRDYSQQYQDRIASGADFFSTLRKYLELSSLDWIQEFFPDLPPIN